MFQVDAFEGLVVSVDGKTSAVQVGVEFLVAVDNSKQFPLMFAYLDSTSVRALLAKATGLRSCLRAAPRPFMEAST